MDQVKIGKLIAMLRKEKGLTQGELGEIVGVSDGAVSKWERGTTCPDISIIHLLSKTLGITSDELLSGELSKETKSKLSRTKKLKTILPQIIIFLIIATISVFIIVKNSTNMYKLKSNNNEYTVRGRIDFSKDKITLQIDEIIFNEKSLNKKSIKNYEYRIKCDSDTIFRKGHIDNESLLSKTITIGEFSQMFKVNYSIPKVLNKSEIINSGITINIIFKTDDNELINKKITVDLVK